MAKSKPKASIKMTKKRYNRLMTYCMEAKRHERRYGSIFPPKISDLTFLVGWSKKQMLEFKKKVPDD